MKKILFLCTGNYFRSRFAEIYFNFHCKNSNLISFPKGFQTGNTKNVGLISAHAVEKLNQLKILVPINLQFPSTLTEDDLSNADVIIAMYEVEHRQYVKNLFPEWEGKFIFWEIKDIDEEDSNSSLEKLKNKIDELILHLQHPV